MASPIDATLLLCDAAVADPAGKIHMLGAGWSVTSVPTAPSAVAVFLKIPWDRTNLPLPCTLQLLDADGHPVLLDENNRMVGEGMPLRIEQTVEVGRPPGLPAGTPIDANFQVTVGSLFLEPGRFQWKLTVAEGSWVIAFTVRAPVVAVPG